MHNLKKLYTELIRILIDKRDKYPETNLAVFSSSVGKNYNGNVMVVGRAVNGWKHNLNPYSEQSVQECVVSLHHAIDTDNLDWVQEKWECRNDYNTRKSAFWRVAKSISAVVNSHESFHTDAIAWTNLYKVAKAKEDDPSKKAGGNPSGRLQNAQFTICKQIFDAEVELLKPKNIVFLTGMDWVGDFLSSDESGYTRIIGGKYVVRVGMYRNSNYIVGQHPQGKNETQQLKEIVEHLS